MYETVQLNVWVCFSCFLGWFKISNITPARRLRRHALKMISFPSYLDRFQKRSEELQETHNTSEQWIQELSISLLTRLSGSGVIAEVMLFQKWNVKEPLRIFFRRSSCSALSPSVAGVVKYLFAVQMNYVKNEEAYKGKLNQKLEGIDLILKRD